MALDTKITAQSAEYVGFNIGRINLASISGTNDILLQMLQTGAGGSFGGVTGSDNKTLEQHEERERRYSAAATRTLIDTISETEKNLLDFINENWTPEAERAFGNAIKVLADPESTDKQKLDSYKDMAKALHEILKNSPAYDAMTPEEKKSYLKRVTPEKLKEKLIANGKASTEAEAEAIIKGVLDYADESDGGINEFISVIVGANKDYKAAIGQFNAVSLTDEMKETQVISFEYKNNKTSYTAVYSATSMSKDLKSLINNGESDQKYYSVDGNGNFYLIPLQHAITASPEHGAQLAKEIQESGLKFSDLHKDVQEFLRADHNISNLEDLFRELKTQEFSTWIVNSLMADKEGFVKIVGAYAMRTKIEAEIADGQLFANDPKLMKRLENARNWQQDIDNNPADIIRAQQDSINALEARIETLKNGSHHWSTMPFIEIKIKELSTQAETMEVQLAEYQEATKVLNVLKEDQTDVHAATEEIAEKFDVKNGFANRDEQLHDKYGFWGSETLSTILGSSYIAQSLTPDESIQVKIKEVAHDVYRVNDGSDKNLKLYIWDEKNKERIYLKDIDAVDTKAIAELNEQAYGKEVKLFKNETRSSKDPNNTYADTFKSLHMTGKHITDNAHKIARDSDHDVEDEETKVGEILKKTQSLKNELPSTLHSGLSAVSALVSNIAGQTTNLIVTATAETTNPTGLAARHPDHGKLSENTFKPAVGTPQADSPFTDTQPKALENSVLTAGTSDDTIMTFKLTNPLK